MITIQQKIIYQWKNIVYLIVNILLFFMLSACSATNPEVLTMEQGKIVNDEPKEPDKLNESLAPEKHESILFLASDEITDILFEKIPALNDIAIYINKQSQGNARLVIQAFDLVEGWDYPRYPVYIGEEWEGGHRVNWYSLSVSQEVDDVRFEPYSASRGDFDEEWQRLQQQRIRLIQKALLDKSRKFSKWDEWTGDYGFNTLDRTAGWVELEVFFDLFGLREMMSISVKEMLEDKRDSAKKYRNFIEVEETHYQEALTAYNDFLNGQSFIEYQQKILFISDIMKESDYSDRKYTLYDINNDGTPELVLTGVYLYILSYSNRKLSVEFSDQYAGGSYKLVNDGYLYYRHGGIANQVMHCYEKINNKGENIRYFSVFCYAYPDYENDSWHEIYTYRNDEGNKNDEEDISEEEYDKLVEMISNDDEIDWQKFYFPDSKSLQRLVTYCCHK